MTFGVIATIALVLSTQGVERSCMKRDVGADCAVAMVCRPARVKFTRLKDEYSRYPRIKQIPGSRR
jgi:hypothetical protein